MKKENILIKQATSAFKLFFLHLIFFFFTPKGKQKMEG